MGLGSSDLDVLMRFRRGGHLPTPGSVIEVGAQQLSNSFFDDGHLHELAKLFNVVPTFIRKLGGPAGNGNDLPPDAPLARPFWEAIGFTCASIDIDGSPNSVPLDLNYDDAPKKYHEKFTLVTTMATTGTLLTSSMQRIIRCARSCGLWTRRWRRGRRNSRGCPPSLAGRRSHPRA
jgi:hypothetical protein